MNKKKRYINIVNSGLFMFGASLIVVFLLVVGLVDNINIRNNDFLFASDIDDDYNILFRGGEYEYRLSVGDIISIDSILNSYQFDMNNIDYSTFKYISNDDESIVKFNSSTKEVIAVSEGEDRLVFSLNNENIVLNLVVKPVSTSNASVSDYSLKVNSFPRFKASISGGRLSVVVLDYTGINTNDVELYKVDEYKKVIKKLNLSFTNLISGRSVKYKCSVLDNDVFSDGYNYFYIRVKDKSGNVNETYFRINKNGASSYARNYAPTIKNWKLLDDNTISFYLNDGAGIQKIEVYDLNNSKNVVLSRNNLQASDVSLGIDKLVLSSSGRYNIEIFVSDVDGNIAVRTVSFRTVKSSSEVRDGYKVLINPSHQIYNGTKYSNSKYANEREKMYIFASYVKTELESRGYSVYISKKDDGTVKLNKNVQIKPLVKTSGANKENVIYLALHSNAYEGKSIGPAVYYYSKESNSKMLASLLCDKVTDVYIDKYTGFKKVMNKKGTNGLHVPSCLATSGSVAEPKYFYDVGGKGAAALVEIGYHDNKDNEMFIRNNASDLARGVANAIDSYLGK